MHADYYEGILQLRNPSREVVSFVERLADQFTNVRKLSNGFDYYFVSQRVLRSLGKNLQSRFAGELKTSRKLHTRHRQTGKAVYRVTVLFRCYNITKGEILTVRGDNVKVLAIGKKVYVQDQKTGKKKWLSYDMIAHLRDS